MNVVCWSERTQFCIVETLTQRTQHPTPMAYATSGGSLPAPCLVSVFFVPAISSVVCCQSQSDITPLFGDTWAQAIPVKVITATPTRQAAKERYHRPRRKCMKLTALSLRRMGLHLEIILASNNLTHYALTWSSRGIARTCKNIDIWATSSTA